MLTRPSMMMDSSSINAFNPKVGLIIIIIMQFRQSVNSHVSCKFTLSFDLISYVACKFKCFLDFYPKILHSF